MNKYRANYRWCRLFYIQIGVANGYWEPMATNELNTTDCDERETLEKNAEDWADELDGKIDSGGGCTEAWGAIQEAREAAAAEQSGPSASRRTVLQGIVGAVGAALTPVVAQTAAAQTDGYEHLEVRVLDGSERDAVIDEMQGSSEYQSIKAEMEADGWTQVSDDEWIVLEFADKERDLEFETVDAPMESDDMESVQGCAIEYNNDPDANELCLGVLTEEDEADPEFETDDAVRTTGDLNFREGPGLDYDTVETYEEDSTGRVLKGPVTNDDIDWYLLNVEDSSHEAWASSNYLTDVEFYHDQRVQADEDGASTWEDPNEDSEYLEWYEADSPARIVDGPEYNDGYEWYYVHYIVEDEYGWTPDIQLTETAFHLDWDAVTTTDDAEGRESPEEDDPVLDTFDEGTGATVVDGPWDSDGYRWWRLLYPYEGVWRWTIESELTAVEDQTPLHTTTHWRVDGDSVTTEVKDENQDNFNRVIIGSKRNDVIAEAKDNHQFQAVRDEMERAGYELTDDDEWEVQDVYSASDDRLFQLVDAPMEPTDEEFDEREDCSLEYSNSPDAEKAVTGAYVEHVHDVEDPYYDETVWYYSSDAGDVVSVERETPNLLGCDNPDWACFWRRAEAVGHIVAPCGGALAGQWWLIPLCISAIGYRSTNTESHDCRVCPWPIGA
jgi:uncharacterized protein YgiM (DUF1202 family)